MTWNEYCDFKYFIQKEYYYYSHTSYSRNDNDQKYEYYRSLDNKIADFEKEIIVEVIKNISKENFKKMLDK